MSWKKDPTFQEKVSAVCQEHYKCQLSKKGKPQEGKEWTLLAAFVLSSGQSLITKHFTSDNSMFSEKKHYLILTCMLGCLVIEMGKIVPWNLLLQKKLVMAAVIILSRSSPWLPAPNVLVPARSPHRETFFMIAMRKC